MLEWHDDEETVAFITAHLPQEFLTLEGPIAQFPGRLVNINTWGPRVIDTNLFPQPFISSPENIISCFTQGNYLNGLVLVISWGTMWRNIQNIYNRPLNEISDLILESSDLIRIEQNIENAWSLLSLRLNWSNVLISKLLHFLSRSLGFSENCPVPIDNAIVLEIVWPAFVNNVPRNVRPRPWGNDFHGYLRYMTFINYLRETHYPNWTNTQIESTIFANFR